ncbi:MAG: response regulator, partial [Spirochaetes bacterium]|nr:response regulator [Spirochaetota bacterium]
GGALRATAADGFALPAQSDWRWSYESDRAVFAQDNWTSKSTAVASTPWSVAFSLPNEAVYGPVRQQLFGVALSVALVLLGGIAGAFLLVRPLAGGIVLRTEELESEVESKTTELQDELVRRSAAESNLAESNTRLRDTNAELARAVAEAQAQREAAEQANQAKTAFLGNMSHDLRTPLQGILGFLSLLSETVESTDQVKYVRYAEESAGDLLRHVDELLEISRIESGGIKIVEAEFSLRESVRSLLEALRPQALHKSVSLSAHVTSGVPEQIRSDSARIRQILSNLLGNAIKYTSVGWIYAHLDYAHQSGNRGTLTISVHDTGPGIPESEIERIFDRFARLDYTTHTGGGVGLGLTITKSIVAMMGGTISCESTVGEGSVFRVVLPVTASQLHRGEQTKERAPYGDTRNGSFRLIMAEDDRMNQILLGHLFRRLGHEVTVAGNGQEAIELLEEQHYDAVFMDVQMPVMNGLDATRTIREATDKAYTDVPIVGMTAYADLVEQRQFLQAGMNYCVTKPVGEEDLRNALEELQREHSPTGQKLPRK